MALAHPIKEEVEVDTNGSVAPGCITTGLSPVVVVMPGNVAVTLVYFVGMAYGFSPLLGVLPADVLVPIHGVDVVGNFVDVD